MNIRSISKFSICILTFASLTNFGKTQQDSREQMRVVATSKLALMTLPPSLVCQQGVTKYVVSDSGESVLVERTIIKLDPKKFTDSVKNQMPPDVETQVVLWNSVSKDSKVVWSSKSSLARIAEMSWMKNGETALFVVNDATPPQPNVPNAAPIQRTEVYRVTSAAQRALKVYELLDNPVTNLSVLISPVEPIAFLTLAKFDQTQFVDADGKTKTGFKRTAKYYVMRSDGKPGAEIDLSLVPDGSLLTFDAVGNPVFMYVSFVNKKKTERYFLLNPNNLSVKELSGKLTLYAGAEPSKMDNKYWNIGIMLSPTKVVAPGGKSSPLSTAWIVAKDSTEKPTAYIGADVVNARFIGKDRGIIYQNAEGLWHIDLAEMSLDDYRSMKAAAERMVALNNAKQAGLAILMYSQDYDEQFPTGDDFNKKIFPYIKDQSVLDNFTYTYGGGLLSMITDPANTEIGYSSGPGGRAVVYADGHAKWKPN